MIPELIRVAAPEGVTAVFTTRRGGTSAGPYDSLNLAREHGDDPAAVDANLAAVAAAVGLPPGRLVRSRQVHGARVRRVTVPEAGEEAADGMVTTARGVGLLALGADCLPVLLWRADGSAVAVAHAGWRGLAVGVVEAVAAALGPGPLGAAIGPGIGPCCYPVGAAVRRRLEERFGPEVTSGPAVALALAARRALAAAGVDDAAVTVVEACTACEGDRLFSHRRDGSPTGRQGGLVLRA